MPIQMNWQCSENILDSLHRAGKSRLKFIFLELKVKFDFLDLNLDMFKGAFQSQSISELRQRMIGILKEVFALLQEYSAYFKKTFYVISLLLVIIDTYK